MQSSRGFALRISVIVFGVILLFILFLSNKTNIGGKSQKISGSDNGSSQVLPPLSPEEKTDKWIALVEKDGNKNTAVLDSLIAHLASRRRFDYALKYTERKMQPDSLPALMLDASEFALKASQMEIIAKDSLLSGGFISKAISYAEKVLRKDSLNEKALLTKGRAYLISGSQENLMKGILGIRKVTEINPKNAEAQFEMGINSLVSGQNEKAEARFEKVIELEPQNWEAMYQLGVAKAALGKKEEAISLWQKAEKSTSDAELKQKLKSLLNP